MSSGRHSERWHGRYEPVARVGLGGESEVWRAVDHQHDRPVALKVRPVPDPDASAEVLAETRALLGLRPHPGLPVVRDDFFVDDRHVMVVDWIPGQDLDARLGETDGGLAASEALGLLEQVAAALDHLHRQDPPVVHGDVKPSNLICTSTGEVVLVDLGLSGAGADPSGSPGYRAPEVAAGHRRSPAADIYGLAATALCLLTGHPPTGQRPDFTRVAGAHPDGLERAIRRGLATDPARRPGSASDLVRQLRAAIEGNLPTGVVTFLLTDIEGSTALWDADPRAMQTTLEQHDALVTDVIEGSGGWLIKSKGEGDSTLSVFERATDAVGAAVALQRRLSAEQWPVGGNLRVRASVHTGEAQLREGDYYGPTVNRAARIRGLAAGGETLLSEATAALVADDLQADWVLVDRGTHVLKGMERGEHVVELRWDVPADRSGARELPPVTLPPTLHVRSEVELVGRDHELAAIVDAVEDARTGRSCAVVVQGEPGIGKTRLVSEAASRAAAKGTIVLAGRCDRDVTIAYHPFVEALDGWMHQHAGRPPQDLLGEYPEELLTLLGRGPEDGSVTMHRGPAGTGGYTVFAAVGSWLRSLARQGPVVLVVDDLQWAREGTRHMLAWLASRVADLPLALLTTLRVDERAAVRGLIDDLRRSLEVHQVEVGGLEEADVAEWIHRSSGTRPGDEAVHRVTRETGGNPLFLTELAGLLDHEDLGSHAPPAISDAVLTRLERLDAAARAVAEVAAVAGLDTDVALITDHDPDRLEALDRATGTGLLTRADGRTVRFVHAISREVVLDSLAPGHRARLHQELASRGRHLGLGSAVVAHHLCQAAGLGLAVAPALEALSVAAEDALARDAPTDVLSLAEQAEDLADPHPLPLSLDVTLAEAQHALGLTDQAREVSLRAARRALDSDDPSLVERALRAGSRGLFSEVGVPDQERLRLLRDALDREPDAARSASLASMLAVELVNHNDPTLRAERFTLADSALATARASGSDRLLAHVLLHGFNATWVPRTLEDRQAETAELVRVADTLGDRSLQVHARMWQFLSALERSAGDEAREVLRAAERLAGEVSVPIVLALLRTMEAIIAGLDGEPDWMERLASEAHAHGVEAGQPDRDVWLTGQLWTVLHLRGEITDAIPVVQQMAAERPDFPVSVMALNAARSEAGLPVDVEWVHTTIRSAESLVEQQFGLSVLCSAAMDIWAVEPGADVTGYAEILRRYREHSPPIGTGTWGPAEIAVGVIEAWLGDADAARAAFDAAVDAARRLGSLIHEANAHRRRAEAFHHLGLHDEAVTAARAGLEVTERCTCVTTRRWLARHAAGP